MNVSNIEKYHTGDGWRYRVRWSLQSGERRSQSFRLRRDADAMLRKIESDRMRGIVVDPRGSDEMFHNYARSWLSTRPLAPRTVELYRSELNKWILPSKEWAVGDVKHKVDGFANMKLGAITTERVRKWHDAVSKASSPITAAKCYRLLRAILGTAEDDSLIPRNPCKIKGAGNERSVERPLLSADQVLAIAGSIEPRYRALVLVGAYGSLRRGELLALRRRHVNELHGTISVEGQAQIVSGQGRVIRATKSDAGVRVVNVASGVMAELVAHMDAYSGPEPDAWVFTAEKGGPAREADLGRAWRVAAKTCGSASAHLHDLRHFGGTMAAQSGATLRELQGRLGHSTARAAMIYQHAAEDRDRTIADRMGEGFGAAMEAAQMRREGVVSMVQTHPEPICQDVG